MLTNTKQLLVWLDAEFTSLNLLENKIAEIKVDVKGKDLFVKKQSNSFEEAADMAVEALRRQLKKHKETR